MRARLAATEEPEGPGEEAGRFGIFAELVGRGWCGNCSQLGFLPRFFDPTTLLGNVFESNLHEKVTRYTQAKIAKGLKYN